MTNSRTLLVRAETRGGRYVRELWQLPDGSTELRDFTAGMLRGICACADAAGGRFAMQSLIDCDHNDGIKTAVTYGRI